MCVFGGGRLMFSEWVFLFFEQKTGYEMRISDWSSDVCSSDLSFSFSRIQSETASNTSENRKGMRQPQLSQRPWSTNAPESSTTMSDRRKPPMTLAWMKLV